MGLTPRIRTAGDGDRYAKVDKNQQLYGVTSVEFLPFKTCRIEVSIHGILHSTRPTAILRLALSYLMLLTSILNNNSMNYSRFFLHAAVF